MVKMTFVKCRIHSELLKCFTQDVVGMYQRWNPDYLYREGTAPRRVLTKLQEGVRNNGYDNEEYDYICYVHDIVKNPDGILYEISERCGHGTFGQVLKCQVHYPPDFKEINGVLKARPAFVALKIIKNKPAYFQQALVEVRILQLLNARSDPDDNLVRMVDYFVYRQHLVLVFDLLSVNLYEVLRQNQFRGLTCLLIRDLTTQLLKSLVALRKARILHCDLKPENVILCTNRSTKIKLIDFGSACFDLHLAYTYIQSRFYRSPEVLLGLPYTAAIDMWSLGCVCAEFYLGLPIFPGNSEYDQVARIVSILGLPPTHMLERGTHTSRFFSKSDAEAGGDTFSVKSEETVTTCVPTVNERHSVFSVQSGETTPTRMRKEDRRCVTPADAGYHLRTLEEYEATSSKQERKNKRYHKFKSLREMVDSRAKNMPGEETYRNQLLHFIEGVLEIDPAARWTPSQALMHPFITGEGTIEDWTCPHDPGESEEWSELPPLVQHTTGCGPLLSPEDDRNPESYRPPMHLLPDSYFRSRNYRATGTPATSPMQSPPAASEPRNSTAWAYGPHYGWDSPASVASGRSDQSSFRRSKYHGYRPPSGGGEYRPPSGGGEWNQWSPYPNYRTDPNPSQNANSYSQNSSRIHSPASPMTFEPRSRNHSPWHLASPGSPYQGYRRHSVSESPCSSASESASLMLSDEDETDAMLANGEAGWGRPGNKFDLFQADSMSEYISRHGGIGRSLLPPENRDEDAFRKATGIQSGPVVPKKGSPGMAATGIQSGPVAKREWHKPDVRRSATGSPKSPQTKKGGRPSR